MQQTDGERLVRGHLIVSDDDDDDDKLVRGYRRGQHDELPRNSAGFCDTTPIDLGTQFVDG